jgi:hypothetical protein
MTFNSLLLSVGHFVIGVLVSVHLMAPLPVAREYIQTTSLPTTQMQAQMPAVTDSSPAMSSVLQLSTR